MRIVLRHNGQWIAIWESNWKLSVTPLLPDAISSVLSLAALKLLIKNKDVFWDIKVCAAHRITTAIRFNQQLSLRHDVSLAYFWHYYYFVSIVPSRTPYWWWWLSWFSCCVSMHSSTSTWAQSWTWTWMWTNIRRGGGGSLSGVLIMVSPAGLLAYLYLYLWPLTKPMDHHQLQTLLSGTLLGP